MDEKLIEDILKHLDSETRMGVVRMSVEMDVVLIVYRDFKTHIQRI